MGICISKMGAIRFTLGQLETAQHRFDHSIKILEKELEASGLRDTLSYDEERPKLKRSLTLDENHMELNFLFACRLF